MRLLRPKGLAMTNKRKLIIAGIFVILGIVVFGGSFLIDEIASSSRRVGTPRNDGESAHGSASDNLRGWGWSEGIGWMSLNCYNDYDDDGDFDNCCPGGDAAFCASYGGLAGGDYGVNFNTTNNKLSGYSWSEMAGWICFGETCTPPNKCQGGTNDGGVCTTDENCPGGGFCQAEVCDSGTNAGLACTTDANCPGGTCQNKASFGRTPFACVGRPSWNPTTGALTCLPDKGEDFENTTNLVSQWKMNDSISDNQTSDTVSTNHGSLLPTGTSVGQVKGKQDLALKFDGIDDYIEAAGTGTLRITGDLTIEAWVMRGSAGTLQTIVGKWNENGNQRSYRLWFDANNMLNFSISSNGTAVTTVTQSPKCVAGTGQLEEQVACTVDANCAGNGVCKNKPISDVRKWHHIAGKYVSSSRLMIFVDGELAGTLNTGVPASIFDSTSPLYIGAKFGATALDTHFNGVIDNVSVWNKAKTGNEIFNDARMEVTGFAKAISAKEGGWFSLRGFTRGDKVWGAYLEDYLGFYTLGGFISERHNNERIGTSGLVAHWKFNEHTWNGTAGEVIDGSGNNNHGVGQGGATTIDKGMFANAGDFDGADDYVDLGDVIEGLSAYTVSAWIRLDTLPGAGAHYRISGKNMVSGFSVFNSTFPRIHFNNGNGTAWSGSFSNGSTELITDTWYFVTATVNGTSANVYVNGALDGSATSDYSGLGSNTNNRYIGSIDGAAQFFNGRIDNVSLYNRAKSPTEISADYERRTPYSAGWGDFDDDPPAPLAFNTLITSSSGSCSQILASWEPSTWATSYSYWREQQPGSACDACTDDTTCGTSGYTEYSYLETCSATECQLTDTGLLENTGYCYTIEAHNSTGDTFISASPNSAPQLKSTALCAVSIGLEIDTSVCGQLTVIWDSVTDADGYNTYRGLTSTDCSTSINATGCETVGHIGEALDYDANNDGTIDLVGNWKMNESSGTTVGDSSGSSNTGTVTDSEGTNDAGAITSAVDSTGLFSNARSFDGADDYIDLPNILDPSTSNFTVALWFKVNDYSARTDDQYIIAKEDNTTGGGGGQPWLFLNNSSNASATVDSLASYIGGVYTDTTVVPTAGTWHHAVLTNASGTIKIYINGELKATGTPPTVESTDGRLRLGLSKANTNPFNGVIDNVSMYNVAKTAEQIRVDYEAGNCGGDCGVDSSVVCHQEGVPDGKCGKLTDDLSACCFTDKRIVPFTNYHYNLTATSEAGESLGSTVLSGQTSCYPAPEAGEE